MIIWFTEYIIIIWSLVNIRNYKIILKRFHIFKKIDFYEMKQCEINYFSTTLNLFVTEHFHLIKNATSLLQIILAPF